MMSGISSMSGMMGSMRPDPQQMFNRMDRDGSASLDIEYHDGKNGRRIGH